MKTILSRRALFACALAALALAAPAKAQVPTVRYAALGDPLTEAAVYALQQGLVKSDKVRVEFRPLPVPGLLEAMNSMQFEIIQSGVIFIPKLALGGAPIRVIGMDFTTVNDMATYGILVRNDGSVKDFGDLKGKRLAVNALGATNTYEVRAMLHQKYGISTFLGRQDLQLREVPLPTMPTLLRNKDVDAIYTFYAPLWPFLKSTEFRNLGSPQRAYTDTFKTTAFVALKVSFDPILAKQGPVVKAALDLLEESRMYYEKNPGPIEEIIAKRNNIDRAYLEWSRRNTIIGAPMEPDKLAKELHEFFSVAAKLGELKGVPDTRKLIWTP